MTVSTLPDTSPEQQVIWFACLRTFLLFHDGTKMKVLSLIKEIFEPG
jgi:hypothetical protein